MIRAVLLLILLVVTLLSIAHAANDKDKSKPKPKPQVSTFLARCKADLEVCTNKISESRVPGLVRP